MNYYDRYKAAWVQQNEKIAFVIDDEPYTFTQLVNAIEYASDSLRRRKIKAQERILILERDSIQVIAYFWAAIKNGITPILLNYLATLDKNRQLINSCTHQLLVIERSIMEKLGDSVNGEQIIADDVSVHNYISFSAWTDDCYDATDDDDLYGVCTSGSTGLPKIVLSKYPVIDSVLQSFACGELRATNQDVLYSLSKMCYAYGLINGLILGCTSMSKTIVYSSKPSIPSILNAVEKYRPTFLFAVPTTYLAISQYVIENQIPARVFDSIRTCYSAGENLSLGVIQLWEQATNQFIINGYGTAEIAYILIANTNRKRNSAFIGNALPGVDIKLDREGYEQEKEEIGELYVRSKSVASEYVGLLKETEEAFHDGWYKTNDIVVRRDDGLYYHSKKNRMFKIKGTWVAAEEIEQILLGSGLIKDACVVCYVDKFLINHIAAGVVTEGDMGVPEFLSLINTYIDEHTEHYKRIAHLFLIDDMPLNANGKKDFKKIAELAHATFFERREKRRDS